MSNDRHVPAFELLGLGHATGVKCILQTRAPLAHFLFQIRIVDQLIEFAQIGQHAIPTIGFEVHLDGATMRLYSEMRDPATDRVIARLPAGYQPSAKAEAEHKPTTLVA